MIYNDISTKFTHAGKVYILQAIITDNSRMYWIVLPGFMSGHADIASGLMRFNGNAWCVRHVDITQEYRGQGLYAHILRLLCFHYVRIESDNIRTPEATRVWEKMKAGCIGGCLPVSYDPSRNVYTMERV